MEATVKIIAASLLLACSAFGAARGTLNGSGTIGAGAFGTIPSYSLATNAHMTVACWVSADYSGTPNGSFVTVTRGWNTDNHYVSLYHGGTLQFNSRAGSGSSASVGGPWSSPWLHLAGVIIPGTHQVLYTNGVPAATNASPRLATSLDEVYVWRLVTAASAPNGISLNEPVQHVAVWTTSLTLGELQALAAGASPLTVRPASLTFYAPLTSTNDARNYVGPSLVFSNSPAFTNLDARIYQP